MKKILCLITAFMLTAQISAYEIEVENDTDIATFEVNMKFFKNQYPAQRFQLSPQQQRTFNVPDGVPVQGGIRVRRIINGRAQGRPAIFRPRKMGDKVDIEIKLDDSGRIRFEGELF